MPRAGSRWSTSRAVGSNDRPAVSAGILGLTGIALVLRCLVAGLTVDVPGDGPMRAIAAYEWAQAPHLVTYGLWPPGPLYLSGLVSLVAPDPFWSVRLVNLILGTATVPVFFLLVRRLFSLEIAWVAALLLTVLPLHVELSATSLAETSFVFTILLGLLLLVSDGASYGGRFVLGLIALLWATMTRYEAWWFAPIVVLSVALTSRRWLPTVGAAVATLAFPLIWSVGNFRAVGDPFYGFTMARKGGQLAGTAAVPVHTAVALLARTVTREIGWPLTLSALAGAVLVAAYTRQPLGRDRVLYGAVTSTFWSLMTLFAMQRGDSIFARYLLLGLVLLLPVAALPWAVLFQRAPTALAAGAAMLAVSTLAVRLAEWPTSVRWVTWHRPTDMQACTDWMRQSPYRNDRVVLTEMGWISSYFVLYWPDAAPRRLIVSLWTEDDEVRRFFGQGRPALLVTTRDDEGDRLRIEHALGRAVISPLPLRTFGAIEVRALIDPPTSPH